MKIKDFIKELEKCNREAELAIENEEQGLWVAIEGIEDLTGDQTIFEIITGKWIY